MADQERDQGVSSIIDILNKKKKEFNILLIDDQVHFCHMVQDMLEGTNCKLRYYTDSREGLREALAHKDLDLILLDVEMPDPNGLEILRQLKKSSNSGIPVMMFTAHSEMEIVQTSLQMGAQEYILKPFEVKDFLARIEHVLGAKIVQIESMLQTASTPSSSSRTADSRSFLKDMAPVRKEYIVLLVDHEETTLKLVQETVEDSCCKLLATTKGKEGLKMVQVYHPELILLNMQLPDMNGLAFLQTLRQMDNKIRVVALSDGRAQSIIAEAGRFHLVTALEKPFRMKQFMMAIEKGLQVAMFA
jgi:DNA-binding response OmpR family regulator